MTEYIYGAEPLMPRVTAARPCDDYRLHLTFTNGETRVFNAQPLLDYHAFVKLKDKAFFDSVRVEHGTICWQGDIDYCPDTLYEQSIPAGDTER